MQKTLNSSKKNIQALKQIAHIKVCFKNILAVLKQIILISQLLEILEYFIFTDNLKIILQIHEKNKNFNFKEIKIQFEFLQAKIDIFTLEIKN